MLKHGKFMISQILKKNKIMENDLESITNITPDDFIDSEPIQSSQIPGNSSPFNVQREIKNRKIFDDNNYASELLDSSNTNNSNDFTSSILKAKFLFESDASNSFNTAMQSVVDYHRDQGLQGAKAYISIIIDHLFIRTVSKSEVDEKMRVQCLSLILETHPQIFYS